MMKAYDVLITETTIRIRNVSIKANSEDEAENLIRAYYDSDCYEDDNLWEISDQGGVDFDANEIPS